MNVSRFGNTWAATVCLWKTPENDYERGDDNWIKELVLQVYGIDLHNWPEYLAPESAAEMQGLEEY